MANSINKIIYCFKVNPEEVISAVSLSLLNLFVMQDPGTEFVTIQRLGEQINTCYVNYVEESELLASLNNTSDPIT